MIKNMHIINGVITVLIVLMYGLKYKIYPMYKAFVTINNDN